LERKTYAIEVKKQCFCASISMLLQANVNAFASRLISY